MYTYLIEYKNKIIGVYNNYDNAQLNIKSFFYNKFIDNNIIIKSYYTNSCLLYKEEIINYNNLNESCKIINTLIDDIDTNITNINNVIKNNNKVIDNKVIDNKEIDNKEIDNNKINFNFNQIIKDYNNNKQLFCLKEENLDTNSKINYNLIEEIKNKKINEQKDLQYNINILKIKKEKMKEFKNIYENDLKLFHLFNENKLKSNNFIIPCLFEDKYNLFNKLLNENNLSCHSFIKEFYTNELNCVNLFIKQNISNINEEFEIESDSETTLT
jgi:hypothetical protein